MRILLANHLPFDDPPSGPYTLKLSGQLASAGHRVRCLLVDRPGGSPPSFVRRVTCDRDNPAADFPWDLPAFQGGAHRQPYSALSDDQLASYREALRRALDDEVYTFDPQVMDVQHIWIFGHLALEAGVPYILTSHGQELPLYNTQPRLGRFALEAAENAGRILALNPAIRRELVTAFGDLDDRVVELDPTADAHCMELLVALYRRVMVERFGPASGDD